MSYFFSDNSNKNEIYENEFFYNLGLEFPLSKKVYSYKNKVSYSKEKKIWFIRYKQENNYIYLFGYNYGSDKQLDTKDPLLILKFNLFNAPNMGNGHFAVDNITNEVKAVMNIQYKNYHSTHKSENLQSISPIIVESNNYLDLGNIRDSKELCENIESLLDEIESIFFFKRYLNRINDNSPLKDNVKIEKQTVATVGIKKYENTILENKEEKDEKPSSEIISEPEVKITKCDFCDSEILDEDPFKICKSCRIRICNTLNLLFGDYTTNTLIPLINILKKAKKHNLSRNAANEITTTLNKYKYLHKIDDELQIDYNDELRNFINKYSTKTENKKDNIKNKVTLVAEKIGLNTPFDRTYLKETLNFKNSEISGMIKYLDERNAIIEYDEYYILVDKTNEINGINDNIINKDIKSEIENKTSDETNSVNDKKLDYENNPQNKTNSIETSNEKPTTKNNKTDIEIFYESYEKVLSLMKNDFQLAEIASKLEITENRLNTWIEKGKRNQTPYRLLSDGIKKINKAPMIIINDNNWKKIIEDIKAGFSLMDSAKRAKIPYPALLSYITKGEEGKEGYKKYHEDYQNALNSFTKDKIKPQSQCKICNEILSDESKFICNDCESKKKFAIDLKILMNKLKYAHQFTNENLIVYYNDNEILNLINNLKDYNLVLEDKSMDIFYFEKENIENFLNTYFDEKNPDYKIKSQRTSNFIKEKIRTKKPKKIILTKSKNIPYPFIGLNKDHTFIRPSGSSSKFTLEDVILIHKNYYEDLYSVDEIAKKTGLSDLTIKKLIVRYDEGDFDKFIKIAENEKEPDTNNISICKSCNKKFEQKENENYCKNCIFISKHINANKFSIILQTEPAIIIGTVNNEKFAKELCSIGTTELNNGMNFEEIIENLKEIIIEKRREEIGKIQNNEEPQKQIQKSIGNDKKLNKTSSSKIKIITSIKKELIDNKYSKLKFIGKLPNDKLDSNIINLLNKFNATQRELKLIPLNEKESKIIFNIITKNSQTTKNIEILKKYNWHLKIEK